jgi:hypothetical protein
METLLKRRILPEALGNELSYPLNSGALPTGFFHYRV